MKELIVKDESGAAAYPILIGSEAYNWLGGNIANYSQVIILSDEDVWNTCSVLVSGILEDYTLIKIKIRLS